MKEFLDSKNNIDIKNNFTNKRYYDNTIMNGENNYNMNFGEYELNFLKLSARKRHFLKNLK